MDYLQNYLSVLPPYDRKEVEQLIQENQDLLQTKRITQEEFEALLIQLANRKEKITTLSPTGKTVDAEHFNHMHSNVSLDLKRLYQSHLIVEKVIANYDRILAGTLEDIQREVNELSTRIEELDLKAKGEDGLIIKTYGFEEKDKHLYVEVPSSENAHLFLDRDGSVLKPASINRTFHQHYLSLPIKEVTNALHDTNGNSTATLSLLTSYENTITSPEHPLSYAIDASLETFWSQIYKTKEPAYTTVLLKEE